MPSVYTNVFRSRHLYDFYGPWRRMGKKKIAVGVVKNVKRDSAREGSGMEEAK